MNGRRTATVVDDAATQLGGVSYFGHELKEGKCSVRIQSMTTGHFGTWSCLLVGENGDVFNGQVKVSKGKPYCKVNIHVAVLQACFFHPYSLDTPTH